MDCIFPIISAARHSKCPTLVPTCPRRPSQQYALGQLGAQLGEAGGVLQKLHHLLRGGEICRGRSVAQETGVADRCGVNV